MQSVPGGTVKKKFAAGAMSLLLIGAGAGAVASAATGTKAQAEVGDVVCDVFVSGIRNLHVVQTGARTFDVTYVDQNTLAGEDNTPGVVDRFATLPAQFRDARNVLALGTDVTVSGLKISQSIVTGEAAEGVDADWQVDELLNNESAPWETAELEGSTITWTHDIDARTEVSGGAVGEQVRPSEFMFPWNLTDDAASVLQFTAEFPEALSGEVSLVDSLTGSFWSTKWAAPPYEWQADREVSYEAPGCSVTLAEAATEPATDPATEPATDPAADPGTDPATDPGTDPAADPGTDPGTDPAADPGADPATDPATDPSTEPGTPKPGTQTPGSGQLARTGGADALAVLGVGALLLAAGSGILIARRRSA